MTSLTGDYVDKVIDQVLQSKALPTEQTTTTTRTPSASNSSYEWRRVVHTNGDWETVDNAHKLKGGDRLPTLVVPTVSHKIPFYFGIQAARRRTRDDNPFALSAFCTFYLAYSTWDGRMLNVDQFIVLESKDCSSQEVVALYQLLAKIADQLQCARLSWKEQEKPRWTHPSHPPEFLPEWLFLEMNQRAMTAFLKASGIDPNITCTNNTTSYGSPFNRKYVEQVIRDCLRTDVANGNNRSPMTLRLAGPDDVGTMSHLVHQWAIYEKEPDAVNVTANNYLVDGSGASEEPLFYCILADAPDEEGRVITCGMGVFFFGYVWGEGRFVYLEDLFIEEAHRGMGGGKAIMERLALISMVLDCCKFTWAALDWNTPALNFYRKIGATLKDDLKTTRYRGIDLRWFAEHGSSL